MRKSFRSSLVAAPATLLLLAFLAACGQKGPLMLPPPSGAASSAGR